MCIVKLWRRLIPLFVLALGLFMLNADSVSAKELSLVNNTGEDIVVLNCSPSKSDSWYDDVLGNEIWPNGSTITIDFDRWALADTWDFKAHYSDGYSEDWYDVDVRRVNTIILRKDGTNEYL